MAKVYLDLAAFQYQYPDISLKDIAPGVIDASWQIAVNIVGDSDSNSFAPYEPKKNKHERQTLLYLALAHLLKLKLNAASGANGGLTGRITSASEGSVSVTVETFKADSLTAQWWSQTEEGSLYWLLTSKYRLGGRHFMVSESHPWG